MLTSIPDSLDLLDLSCYDCPLLTSIPSNFKYLYDRTLDDRNCKWLNPNQQRIDNLVKIQEISSEETRSHTKVFNRLFTTRSHSLRSIRVLIFFVLRIIQKR